MMLCVFFFFNDTATTEIYTLSLHDALPICARVLRLGNPYGDLPSNDEHREIQDEEDQKSCRGGMRPVYEQSRSEEHTSELQSRQYLVCRLLLEQKNPPSSSFT